MNYLLYRLTWDAAKQKFQKKPLAPDGSALLEGGGIPTASRELCLASLAKLPPAYAGAGKWQDGYTLGCYFRDGDGYAFLDIDEGVVSGQLTPDAADMAAPLVAAGAFFEPSSSGRGAHVVCRYTGELPPHVAQRPSVHAHGFYTGGRGMVLHPEWHQGSMQVDCTVLLGPMLAKWFPPKQVVTLLAPQLGPRKEWRGPADDDVLLQRALSATGSAAARMGGKLTFAKLWAGDCEHNSENDFALAAHLAFWTGCDADRMERMMLRSGLAREKWQTHNTYLRQITIANACATTLIVYQEPQRVNTVAALLGAPPAPATPVELLPASGSGVDWHTVSEQAVASINNAGTYRELTDNVMPSLGALGLPRVHAERVVTTLARKLDLFDARIPVAALRLLVSPPVDVSAAGPATAPPWMASICYVTARDCFYDYATGKELTHESFRMEFNRFLPLKQNGQREDAVQWARDRWLVPTVTQIEYRPDMPSSFEYAGKQFVNSFRPDTMPPVTEATAEALACIEQFKLHLWHIVGQREHLYVALLCWLAHNVQKPGHKIRWAPLIKGVPGDGKSILGDLIFATMGVANVKMTSNSTLSNSGGFTDWSTGSCVNFIEEIRLEGKDKRRLYNAMKIFISDSRIELNRKGKASSGTLVNITNHAAFTNYEDGVPVEVGERKWTVIFTPWKTADGAASIKGLRSADDLPSYFKRLGVSMRNEAGAWRGWLLSIDTSRFDPDSRAPPSDERESMMHSSGDFMEQTVQDCIAKGGPGVDIEAFCSHSLMGQAHVALGEKPDNRSWNRILTDLGYRQFSTPVWWNGKARRIWTKEASTKEKLLEILAKTLL